MLILLHPTNENSFQTEQVTDSTVRGSTTPLLSVYSSLCWFILWEIPEIGHSKAGAPSPGVDLSIPQGDQSSDHLILRIRLLFLSIPPTAPALSDESI